MRRLNAFLYYFLPFILSCAFLFLETVIFVSYGFHQSFLSILNGAIFYFSVFKPDRLNIFLIFILGILSDYLLQAPFGFQAFMFSLTAFVSYFNRRLIFNCSFATQWAAFSVISFFIFMLGIVFLKVKYGSFIGTIALLKDYTFVVLCYPFIARFCGYVNTKCGDKK